MSGGTCHYCKKHECECVDTMSEPTPRPWPQPVQVGEPLAWWINGVGRFASEADALLAWQAVNERDALLAELTAERTARELLEVVLKGLYAERDGYAAGFDTQHAEIERLRSEIATAADIVRALIESAKIGHDVLERAERATAADIVRSLIESSQIGHDVLERYGWWFDEQATIKATISNAETWLGREMPGFIEKAREGGAMSYDIELRHPVTNATLELDEPHQMRGGTYQVGGTRQLELNVTYNYAKHYQAFGPNGIRTLYGKTGAESIPLLDAVIATLGDDVDRDYWTATEGNAKAALCQLRALATMRPDGVWHGD